MGNLMFSCEAFVLFNIDRYRCVEDKQVAHSYFTSVNAESSRSFSFGRGVFSHFAGRNHQYGHHTVHQRRMRMVEAFGATLHDI